MAKGEELNEEEMLKKISLAFQNHGSIINVGVVKKLQHFFVKI